MANINLLPWRDEYRQEKKREFTTILIGSCIFAGLCVYLWNSWVNNAIEEQIARNQLLNDEINALEARVTEIRELKKRKSELLDRMKIIQDLQGTRPIIVRYFDEMVRAVPDGIFVTQLTRKGSKVDVNGITESNNRVSTFMRRLDGSGWFSAPNLNSVQSAPAFGEQASEFRLSVYTTSPNTIQEEG